MSKGCFTILIDEIKNETQLNCTFLKLKNSTTTTTIVRQACHLIFESIQLFNDKWHALELLVILNSRAIGIIVFSKKNNIRTPFGLDHYSATSLVLLIL